MATPHENGTVTIDNLGSTTLTFANRINSVIVWSADDSFYIAFDADAAVLGTFLHPKDSIVSYAIACLTLGLRAQNGAGVVVNYIATYKIQGVDDVEVEDNRGGVHVAP